MPSPTLAALSYTKTYDDLEVFDEADLDAALNSIQTYANVTQTSNLQQLARDAFGVTDYSFTNTGNATYTNNLFDKQVSTKTYNGGDISILAAADVAYGSVDAINASISFTPEKAGKYRATFVFTHTITTSVTSEGTLETTFRITDSVDASPCVRSGIYLPATAAGSGIVSIPVAISYVFTWNSTNNRTIGLQKYNRTATNILTNVVGASAATGEIYMTVEKI